jgi:excisionase family DNA binding protein
MTEAEPLMRLRYSVPEAAEMLGLHPNTVWKRIHTGELKAVRDGRRVLITYDELHRYATRGVVLKAS